MNSTLSLTYKELSEICRENIDRFVVKYNDIPRDGHSSNYIEDDGRQMRYFEFTDTNTNITYNFSYVWSPDYDIEFPLAFLGSPDNISFVDTSVINPEPTPEPTPEPAVILTPAQQADADLRAKYNQCVVVPFDEHAFQVPFPAIQDILAVMDSESFSMFELRAAIYPVCIKYGVEQKSLWKYLKKIQGK